MEQKESKRIIKNLVSSKVRQTNIEIIGIHTERFRLLMIILSAIMTVLGLFLCIYWEFDENSFGEVNDYVYLVSEILFTVFSAFLVVILVLNNYNKVKTITLAKIIHVYVFFVVAWGTLMCVFDLNSGLTPLFYLFIITAVAGLFVVEPIFFSILCLLSFSVIMTCVLVNKYDFFEGSFRYENIINVFLFMVINVVAAFRHFEVTVKEYRALQKMKEMSFIDELTGLYNDRAYIEETDKIADNIALDKMENFAVVLMDVNNLKNTNDLYGHRYGCHLIVKCGEELPRLFKTSKLFHIGGDEFVAIVMGEDYINLKDRIDTFDKTLSYSLITYDGVELVFSIARGYAEYTKGDHYKDVLQKADKAMYDNKTQVKQKYNMVER